MDLTNQQQTGMAIHRGPSLLMAIFWVAATVALVAVVAGTIWIAGLESRASGGAGTATGDRVSSPVYVELRRDERDAWTGAVNSLSDPVYVEFRQSERDGS